jgi:formylglycine-generating enzyme required for sulfatase activity
VARLLEIYECTTCHRLTTPHRLIGPSLWKIGERADAAYIRTSILEPDAWVAPGYPAGLMRTRLQELGFYADIARQPAILERLVAFLAGAETPAAAVTDREAAMEGMIQLPLGSGRLPNGQAVEVPAFTIDRAPITTAQYAAFIAAGGYATKRYWEREGWAVVVQRRKRTRPTDWEAQQRQAADHAVVGVTWYEADAYCRWLGKALPTAVQWERACQEVPEWYGPESHWEWTAEALWQGGVEPAVPAQKRCATRVQSYPALEGQHTGFRCLALAHTESP